MTQPSALESRGNKHRPRSALYCKVTAFTVKLYFQAPWTLISYYIILFLNPIKYDNRARHVDHRMVEVSASFYVRCILRTSTDVSVFVFLVDYHTPIVWNSETAREISWTMFGRTESERKCDVQRVCSLDYVRKQSINQPASRKKGLQGMIHIFISNWQTVIVRNPWKVQWQCQARGSFRYGYHKAVCDSICVTSAKKTMAFLAP